jgi:hypothetical protein
MVFSLKFPAGGIGYTFVIIQQVGTSKNKQCKGKIHLAWDVSTGGKEHKKMGRTKKISKGIDVNLLFMLVLFLTGCACSGYSGDCFDAKIGQVDVIPLKSKKLLSQYEEVNFDVIDTKWQVLEPVSGKIDVQFSVAAPDQQKWIGDDPVMDVKIIPLDNQQIDTEIKLVHIDNVRINGRSSTAISRVLKTNEVPPGNYLYKVTLRGRNNWDRKTIFVTVE